MTNHMTSVLMLSTYTMEMKPQLKSGLRWTCEAADLVCCAMCACVTWICLDYSITANPATVQVEDDSPQSRHPSSNNFFSSVVVLLCRERGWLRKKRGLGLSDTTLGFY